MAKQDIAFTRLLKKLSALRATLKGDERALLDGLVLGAQDEVSANSMRVIPISPAKSLAKSMTADEAKAMGMKVSSAKSLAKSMTADEAKAMGMKVNSAKSLAKSMTADEAKAMRMKVSKAKHLAKAVTPDEVAAHSLAVHIVFNPSNEEYQSSK